MGALYDELDDAIRVMESNVNNAKTLAATLLEFNDANDLMMGRLSAIARQIGATPILPDATPAPIPEHPTQNPGQVPTQNQGPIPTQPPQKSWGQVLDEITTEPRHYTNGAVPKRTVAAR